jgi:2-polyprenyl-3-methyl-5-hydroxy-6-metoxy-1,4-benzoquinol methylase
MARYSHHTYNYFEECPNCGCKTFHNMGRGTNAINTFHKMVVECEGCGLFFTNPIADRKSMEAFYASYGATHARTLDASERYRAEARKMAAELSNNAKPLRFLDVGAASGEIVQAYQLEGWEAYGIELSEAFVQYAKEKRNLTTILNCEIEDSPFEENFFDYVNFWHVIEHLRDPIIVLKKIYSWLKPGGKLNIGTPNPLTRYGWLAYQYHNRFDLGIDHTFGFPPKTLKNILTGIGFQVELQEVYKPNRKYKSPVKRAINFVGLNNTMQKVTAVKTIHT